MSKEVCKLFQDVDNFFKGGKPDLDKINKEIGGDILDCPYDSKSGTYTCKTDFEGINALYTHLVTELYKSPLERQEYENDDHQYIEYAIMWIGYRLFQTEGYNSPNLIDFYNNHLTKSIAPYGFNYILEKKRHLLYANLDLINELYILFNYLCDIITESKIYTERNKVKSDISNFQDTFTSLYDEVKECYPYFKLLKNFKKIYDDYRNNIMYTIGSNTFTGALTIIMSFLNLPLIELKIPNWNDEYIDDSLEIEDFMTSGCIKLHSKYLDLEQTNTSQDTKKEQPPSGSDKSGNKGNPQPSESSNPATQKQNERPQSKPASPPVSSQPPLLPKQGQTPKPALQPASPQPPSTKSLKTLPSATPEKNTKSEASTTSSTPTTTKDQKSPAKKNEQQPSTESAAPQLQQVSKPPHTQKLKQSPKALSSTASGTGTTSTHTKSTSGKLGFGQSQPPSTPKKSPPANPVSAQSSNQSRSTLSSTIPGTSTQKSTTTAAPTSISLSTSAKVTNTTSNPTALQPEQSPPTKPEPAKLASIQSQQSPKTSSFTTYGANTITSTSTITTNVPTGPTTATTMSSTKNILPKQNDTSQNSPRAKRLADHGSSINTQVNESGSKGGKSSNQHITQENSWDSSKKDTGAQMSQMNSSSLNTKSQDTREKTKNQALKSNGQGIKSKNGSDKLPGTHNGVGSTQGNANPGINNLKNSAAGASNQQKSLGTKQGTPNSVSADHSIESGSPGVGFNNSGKVVNASKQAETDSTATKSSNIQAESPKPILQPSTTLLFTAPGTITTSMTTTVPTGEPPVITISSIESTLSGQNDTPQILSRTRRSLDPGSSISTPTNESGAISDPPPSNAASSTQLVTSQTNPTPAQDALQITTGTDVKINEKSSIWCIGSNRKCNIIGIGIIGISIFAFLAFMFKYLSFGSRKKSKKKKITKKVINLVDGRKMEKTFIKSIDRGKKSNIIINSGDNKKIAKIIINSDDTNKPIKTAMNPWDEKRMTHVTINSEYKKKYIKSVINSGP